MNDLGLEQLVRGCERVYTEPELHAKLEHAAKAKRQLRVKLGMDPTAPDIHIGHGVALRKMRQFQDLGHRAVLLIGDFTARIGDPTGRSKTRPVLTNDEIDANAKTYLAQAGKILDTSPEKLELRRNSEWLDKMDFADVVRLCGRMTVGQLLKREDFRNRFESETPISLHELLYPLAQGWDSVNLEADVELGGSDQTYNNLVGRDLQQQSGQQPQIVMILPLLRGDAQRKMSKSYGNYIGVTDSPTDMFGKTMAIPDELLAEWYRLLTDLPEDEWKPTITRDPMQAKKRLARLIGQTYYSADEMARAEQWWLAHFSARRADEPIELHLSREDLEDGSVPAWKLAWLAHERDISKSEARRMVAGGAFQYDGTKITDPNQTIRVSTGDIFRAGRFRKGERTKQPLLVKLTLA